MFTSDGATASNEEGLGAARSRGTKPVLSSIRVRAARARCSIDDKRSSEAGGLAFPVETEGDPGVRAGREERRGTPTGRHGVARRGAERIGANANRPANCTARS